MAGAIAVGAGLGAREVTAHRGPGFINRAISLLREVFTGEQFLAPKFAQGNDHGGDSFHLGDI